MHTRTHTPVLDYFLSALRTHRSNGTVHAGAADGTESYVLHVIRLADTGALTGAEALVAANRALRDLLALPALQEDRREIRVRA